MFWVCSCFQYADTCLESNAVIAQHALLRAREPRVIDTPLVRGRQQVRFRESIRP